MSQRRKRIAIIGAGASGIFCAADLMESAGATGLSIDIFEALDRPLQKVRVSGGGRCNLSHATADVQELIAGYPRGNKFLRPIFHTFHSSDTVRWFEGHGVKTYVDASGCVFPSSDRSESVVAALLAPLESANVEIKCRQRVDAIRYGDGHFSLHCHDFSADYDIVLIASGGAKCISVTAAKPNAYQLAQNLGHHLITPRPGLCGMFSLARDLADLAGIVIAPARVSAVWQGKKVGQSSGEVLFTHRGISGPAILNLSSVISHLPFNRQNPLIVNLQLTATTDISNVNQAILQAIAASPNKNIANILSALPLARNLAKCVLDRCEVDPGQRAGNITRQQRGNIVQQLFAFSLPVYDLDRSQAMVTCGGIDLRQVSSRTLQSKLVPRLYFAGEVLDVDGFCGGFNLQFAWSSAYVVSRDIQNL